MDEFDLIQKYFVQQGEVPGVSTGIGDDGAVMQPDPGKEVVAVVDTLVEGVHFPAGTDPFDIAYRVVAVNLSDVAAMGARPRWMTLAMTLPKADAAWLARFSLGLHAAAESFDVALVGGDTTSGTSVVVTVQIIADVDTGMAIRRSGAEPGDAIYVTGNVGDAAAGLELLATGKPDSFLSARFLRPDARIDYGQMLTGTASAAIDVSDGLFADLSKLLSASGAGGVLNLESLPLSDEAMAQFDDATLLRLALTGGDDYELCFTAHPDSDLPASEIRVTKIGEVAEGDELQCRVNGALVPYEDSGYRHFE